MFTLLNNFTYFKKADSVILVYDPSLSIEKVKENFNFWIENIKQNADYQSLSKCIWIVANNKSDNLITEGTEKIKTNLNDIPIHVINNLKNNDLSGVNVSLY